MWKPGWTENKSYRALQEKAVAGDNWIIEGSSISILKTIKDRADLVIILNYPPVGNIIRIIKRYLNGIFFREKRTGWKLENNNELRFGFLLNTLKWRTRQLPRIRANITGCALENRIIEINLLKNVFETVVFKIENII